eukprot:UN17047
MLWISRVFSTLVTMPYQHIYSSITLNTAEIIRRSASSTESR